MADIPQERVTMLTPPQPDAQSNTDPDITVEHVCGASYKLSVRCPECGGVFDGSDLPSLVGFALAGLQERVRKLEEKGGGP